MKAGVYKISNFLNKRCYIGSSINLKARLAEHKNDLRKGNHHSLFMQRDFDACGEAFFDFDVLETINDIKDLIKREQYYIDKINPEYNTLKFAGSSLGAKASPEAIEKNRLRNTGFGNGNCKIKGEVFEAMKHYRQTHTQKQTAQKFGVNISTIQRIEKREGLSFSTKIYSKEGKQILSKNAKTRKSAVAKKVEYISPDGVVVVFCSITQAAKALNISKCTVFSLCRNICKTRKYDIRYAELA